MERQGQLHEAALQFQSLANDGKLPSIEDGQSHANAEQATAIAGLQRVLRKLQSDHYAALTLNSPSSVEDVRKSYKKLALRFHPDRNKNGAPVFVVIQSAYEFLCDDSRKRRYDKSLATSASMSSLHAQQRTGAEGGNNHFYQRYQQQQQQKQQQHKQQQHKQQQHKQRQEQQQGPARSSSHPSFTHAGPFAASAHFDKKFAQKSQNSYPYSPSNCPRTIQKTKHCHLH